jgi:hypothetical protein
MAAPHEGTCALLHQVNETAEIALRMGFALAGVIRKTADFTAQAVAMTNPRGRLAQ